MSLDDFTKILNSICNQFTTRDLPLGLPLTLTCVVRSGIIREATYRDNDDDRNRKRPDKCSICRHPAAEK
mgnify:CR=1 FL=1